MREMSGDTNGAGLRIDRNKDGLYFVGSGCGMTYRCYGAATGIRATEKLRRDVAKAPDYYGFDRRAVLAELTPNASLSGLPLGKD